MNICFLALPKFTSISRSDRNKFKNVYINGKKAIFIQFKVFYSQFDLSYSGASDA